MVEMLAVLAILAVLAAIAVPSLSRYVKRSRTSEAVMNVERMWQSAVAYFHTEHSTPGGDIVPAQFPSSAPATPAHQPVGIKYEVEPGLWTHPAWDALNFAMSSPHYYQYGFYNRSDEDAPPGGGGVAFGPDGPFSTPGGPMGAGPFGSDGKPSAGDKDDKPVKRKVEPQHELNNPLE